MDLFWVFIIIGIISKLIKADKKKQEAQRQQARRAAGQAFTTAAQKPAAPKAEPARPTPVQTMLPPRPEPAQPLVHTHLAPDCEEHDKPGSLNAASREGKDACHAGQLAPANQPRTTAGFDQEDEPGLQLDWSGENMVKAFIMQEVLTRPCERRRRA